MNYQNNGDERRSEKATGVSCAEDAEVRVEGRGGVQSDKCVEEANLRIAANEKEQTHLCRDCRWIEWNGHGYHLRRGAYKNPEFVTVV